MLASGTTSLRSARLWSYMDRFCATRSANLSTTPLLFMSASFYFLLITIRKEVYANCAPPTFMWISQAKKMFRSEEVRGKITKKKKKKKELRTNMRECRENFASLESHTDINVGNATEIFAEIRFYGIAVRRTNGIHTHTHMRTETSLLSKCPTTGFTHSQSVWMASRPAAVSSQTAQGFQVSEAYRLGGQVVRRPARKREKRGWNPTFCGQVTPVTENFAR